MCLVKASQFDDLAHLLSPSELQPLRPLVLLVGWDHCTDVETARCLLRALCVGRVILKNIINLDRVLK